MRGFTALVVLAGCGHGSSSGTETPPSIAHDDHVVIDEDQPLDSKLLLANDENVGCAPRVTLLGTPAHGSFDTNYASRYLPDPGFHGTDSFTYQISGCNYGISNVATVTVDVKSDGVPYEQAKSLDGTAVSALASGDIDGDGRIDLVIADEDASNVAVLANRTTSGGAYAVERIRFEGGHAPVAIAVADLDGDGRPDIVTASKADGLVILRNATPPGGAIAFDAPIYVPAGNAVGVVAVDLDGDGKIDLASIDSVGDRLDVRLNQSAPGALAFGVRTSFPTPNGPTQIDAVDADGVGGMDLVVLAVDRSFQNEGAGTFSLFVNATAVGATVPAFAARTDRATGQYPTAIFVADLDGDHRPEIGVLDDGLWVYANQSVAGSPPAFEAARVLDISSTAAVVAPADLDGVGNLDLVVGSNSTDPFSVLLNTTTPTTGFGFESHQSVIGTTTKHAAIQSVRPTSIRFVDLDGVPPAEVVVGSQGGTLVLFGD